ncbi:MAG: glucose-6-phosphate isomerase family protein [Leucobacter sp.]
MTIDPELGPRAIQLNGRTGQVSPEWRRASRTLKRMAGLFAASVPQDRAEDLVYGTSTPALVEAEGELGLNETRIEAGDLDGEFFMTHGHIHVRPDGEVYLGQSGYGGVLLERDGDVRWVAMGPGTACYIPPKWKHRSVNTGAQPFVFLSVYTALAGQDYAAVRQDGMGARVMRTAGGYRVVADDGRLIDESNTSNTNSAEFSQ